MLCNVYAFFKIMKFLNKKTAYKAENLDTKYIFCLCK